MIYILEGADCSGKSSCYRELQDMYANKVIGYGNRREVVFRKESKAGPEEMPQRLEAMLIESTDQERDYVYDRCSVIDDFVYSPVVDQQPSAMAMLEDARWKVEAILARAVVFHFTAPIWVVAERLQARGDDNVTVDHIGPIESAYRRFYNAFHVNPLIVETGRLSITEAARHVGAMVFRKEFKFAHITPLHDTKYVSDVTTHGYQMCLANQVAKDGQYTEMYATLSKEGAYVLMDNGAAEGEQLGLDELWDAYGKVQPTEIVLRDVLFNGTATLAKHYEQLAYLEAKEAEGGPLFKLMAVPQGKDFEEWAACADEILRTMPVNTIGVSKFVTEWDGGDVMARAKCLKQLHLLMVKHSRPDLEVHLLGCMEPPATIKAYQKAFPFVRGIDSVVAYNCAAALADPEDGRPKRTVDLDGGGQAGPEAIANKQQDWERLCGINDNGLTGLWKQVV